MSDFKQPVSVLVVIHTPALDVLLIERARAPGFWQSVTGSREGEETLAQTARREVFEETGIRAPHQAFIDWQQHERFEIFRQWRHRYAPGVRYNTEHVFSVSVARDTPITLAPEEHRAARWLPWREGAETVFSWTNRNALLALPQRVGVKPGECDRPTAGPFGR